MGRQSQEVPGTENEGNGNVHGWVEERGAFRRERIRIKYIRTYTGVIDVRDKMRERQLHLFGHAKGTK